MKGAMAVGAVWEGYNEVGDLTGQLWSGTEVWGGCRVQAGWSVGIGGLADTLTYGPTPRLPAPSPLHSRLP